MTLFKQTPEGAFEVLEQTPFGDLEKKLEDWIERNPAIISEGEPLAVVSRQPRTTHGKFLDLLAVDRRGSVVVVELKRGEAPREVLAQALEYAAWVDSLSFDQLNEIAKDYAARKGIETDGLHELYTRAFSDGASESEFDVDPALITFNTAQTVVIVAEEFAAETEQTARYLRVRQGTDIRLVKFSVHRAGGEIVLQTTTVVGREALRPPPPPVTSPESDDDYRDYVKTDFMRSIIGTFDQWVAQQSREGLVMERPRGARRIRFRGIELAYFYYAQRWLTLWLNSPDKEDLLRAREGLTRPNYGKEDQGGFWCRLYEPADVELIKALLARRIASMEATE